MRLIPFEASLFGLHVRKEEEEGEKQSRNHNLLPEEVREEDKIVMSILIDNQIDIGSMLAGGLPREVEAIRLYDGKKQERFEMRETEDEKKQVSEREKRGRWKRLIQSKMEPFIEDYRKQCIMGWKKDVKENEESELKRILHPVPSFIIDWNWGADSWAKNLNSVEIKDWTLEELESKKWVEWRGIA